MLNEDAGDDAPAAQEQLGGAGGPTITREQVLEIGFIISKSLLLGWPCNSTGYRSRTPSNRSLETTWLP